MNDMDRVYSDRLIKFIINKIFVCFVIVLFVRKLVGVIFVVKCVIGFVVKVIWVGEIFGGFSFKRYFSVFVIVEFDIFYYLWFWEVCFIYDFLEFVFCYIKKCSF